MKGWISMHRKLMKNPVWQDPNYLKLWMYCLFKATHTEHEQLVGNTLEKLEPGQFVTGREALEEDMNEGVKPKMKLSQSTWWRYLNNLEKWKMLNIKKTNKYSVVSILNWSYYQNVEQQMNNKWTSNEQQLNTNNNVNNGFNVNNEIKEEEKGPGDIIDYWDSNGFGFQSNHQKEKILKWADDGGFSEPYTVIHRALEVAADRGANNFAYTTKILTEWKNKGVKDLNGAESAIKEFNKSKGGYKGGRNGKGYEGDPEALKPTNAAASSIDKWL